MVNYSVLAQRFNTEFRNGSSFSTNPTTDYSIDLKANVGELCKFTQQIQISVTVNPDLIQTIQYNATTDATYGEFIGTGINWLSQGIYVGATLHVSWGATSGISVTVNQITGPGYSVLKVTKSNLTSAGIVDGDVRVDFKFKMTSVPDTLIYKYGLNPNDYTGTSYKSWFDDNVQAYYISNLTTSLQTMTRVGMGIKSWDISTVQAKFDSTSSTYFHTYTVEHIFRVPFYVSGEYENINDNTSPDRFLGTASVRYDNGWFFGGTTLGEYIAVEIKGGPGNVGYFYESYNGYANNYQVLNASVSNADNSGVLEGSVTNTLTFQIVKGGGNFTSSSKVILYHAKLPTQTEYQNKVDTFNYLWIFESLVTTETAAPVSGTVLTNFNVTLNANPTILDCTVDIQYSTAQQALISDGSDYLVWVGVGNEGAINPDDRVAIPVMLNQFSKNLDVPDLITDATVTFFEPFEFYTGTRDMSSWTGLVGDLGGTECTITRTTGLQCAIVEAHFKIISTNGTESMELLDVNIPLGKPQLAEYAGYYYQQLNVNTVGYLNLPTHANLSRLKADAEIPLTPTTEQYITFSVGFQTPWRDWIFNNSVPASQYNSSLPQNNQNYKTSNYSNNADGFEVFPVWDFVVRDENGVDTTYRKLTSEANVTDFDTNGTAGFSGVVSFIDSNGFPTNNIHTDENTLVKIEFAHSLGTIALARIEGYIWIERENSSEQPWYLHNSIDFTQSGSPLMPSDTLGTSNSMYVEVVSANNLITLYCLTNHENIQEGATYNIYGRIKNKLVL